MGAVEVLKAAVEGATRMDAGTKAIVGGFLEAAGPAIETLGEEGLTALLAGIARGEAAPDAVAGTLTQEQVVALLGRTETAMAAMADERAAQAAAARAAMQTLAEAALAVLAKVLVGVI